MKPKKNPKKDLNKKGSLYFVTGLLLVLLLTFVALEWKTYDQSTYDLGKINVPDELIEEVPFIAIKTLPPPPPPVAPPVIDIADNDEDIIETPILSTETSQETEIIAVDDVEVAEIEEDLEIPIAAVEEKPIFPGCENETDKLACFQKMMKKHIKKNFRYPEAEKEIGIQGRVHVLFTIQKDGSIENLRLRGPNKNLEKEAARIIGKLPQMIPGKQGGKAVKVPFSLPITFKLE